MAIRLLPDEEVRRRARLLLDASHEWTARQIAKGIDGPTPNDRREPSDYNQHVPILEAEGDAQDEFFARLDAILDNTHP